MLEGESAEAVPPLKVGSLIVAKRTTGVCDIGELGVCYEVYELGGRPGWAVIFQSGRHDGFSPSEVELMLEPVGRVLPGVAGYRFENVRRLARDFAAGRFAPVVPGATAGTA